jgi:opacity protein-like surface antigen
MEGLMKSKACAVVFSVALVLVLTPQAYGETDLGLKGLGVKVGFVLPEDPIDNTFGFGAHAKLGTITPGVALDAFLDFWTKGYEEHHLHYTADWSWTQIAVGALAKYVIPTTGNVTPYVGGGFALTYARSSWEWEWAGVREDDSCSDTNIGIHLAGGAEMPLSPTMDGFAEAKYALDGADYFMITVGVIFKMGG